jgi:hemerythrin superfamily protein
MKSQDVVALLRADHKKVKGLLEDLEGTTGRGVAKRRQLLEEISREIEAHARVEEEIFYPAYRAAVRSGDDRELFHEAAEEHRHVKIALERLEATSEDAEQFGAYAKVLKDIVLHHAKEEEREMFPRAKEHMSDDERRELGRRVADRKEALLAAGARA